MAKSLVLLSTEDSWTKRVIAIICSSCWNVSKLRGAQLQIESTSVTYYTSYLRDTDAVLCPLFLLLSVNPTSRRQTLELPTEHLPTHKNIQVYFLYMCLRATDTLRVNKRELPAVIWFNATQTEPRVFWSICRVFEHLKQNSWRREHLSLM